MLVAQFTCRGQPVNSENLEGILQQNVSSGALPASGTMEAGLRWRLAAKVHKRCTLQNDFQGEDFSPIRYRIPVPKDPEFRETPFGRPGKGILSGRGAAWR